MHSQRFLDLLDEMERTHKAKSAGYAGIDNPDAWANFRLAEELGVSAFKGCLIRLSDKFKRMTNLVKNSANNQCNENVKDTLIDMASYALIAICLLEESEDALKSKEEMSILDELNTLRFDTSEAAMIRKEQLQKSHAEFVRNFKDETSNT